MDQRWGRDLGAMSPEVVAVRGTAEGLSGHGSVGWGCCRSRNGRWDPVRGAGLLHEDVQSW